MTFEEFFKKKKINLATFRLAESNLFDEFKTHHEAMGEKSFDHTKKYWFNKLRRLYPAPQEVKVEKLVIENQLAEQTIAETLTESATPASAKTGFTPRFKAAAVKSQSTEPAEKQPEPKKLSPPAKTGFTPRFKAGVTAVKPTGPASEPEIKPNSHNAEPTASTPKAGFKPRFKPPQ